MKNNQYDPDEREETDKDPEKKKREDEPRDLQEIIADPDMIPVTDEPPLLDPDKEYAPCIE